MKRLFISNINHMNSMVHLRGKEMKNKQSTQARQGGFTLIELVVVVAVIGLLIAMVAPNVAGSRDGATITTLDRFSQKLTENWTILSQTCGATTDVVSSPVTANSAANTLKLLVGGTATAAGGFDVPAAYDICYTQSKVLPLTDSAQWDGTAWKVAGFVPTLTWATGFLKITFASVPDSLVLGLAQKYDPALPALKASEATHPVVQYGTATSGARTLTIIRPIN